MTASILAGGGQGALAGPACPASTTRILVVDDDPPTLDLLSYILSQWGYCPIVAPKASQALDWMSEARERGAFPALILLDLHLPDMHGSEFLQVLHEQYAAVPHVIVITADSRSKSFPGFPVLLKPFHLWEVQQAIEQALSPPTRGA